MLTCGETDVESQSPQIWQLPWRGLPKEVINRLNTRDGERFFLIEGPNGDYRLTPYDPAFEKKIATAEDLIGRYRNTLDALSK